MERKVTWKEGVFGLFVVTGLIVYLVNPGWNRSIYEIRETGTLKVLTRNAPTTYYLDAEGKPAGPEYDLIQAFASHMGWKVEFIVKSTTGELFRALALAEGDLIAAGLSKTDLRKNSYRFGPVYQTVTQQVVCRRGKKVPRTVSQLKGRDLWVVGDSSYEERLQLLKQSYNDLTWHVTQDLESEQVLEKVWNREVGCAVADSNIVKINRRYFPELVIGFDLKEPESLAWVLPHNASGLEEAMNEWFATFKEAGGPQAVQARYYDPFEKFDYVNTRRFMEHIDRRYPRYKKWFQRAADKNDLSPIMLAAQAYQESKWNPRARSFTQVKGMMMLTLATARSMGIRNRLDARKSINGGARYMARLKKKLKHVSEPNRTWLALAAYNVGLGHLRDAQTLARQLGKNPEKWNELKEVLPLLRSKKYYKKLKYGYARGLEPVRYVQRIREYAAILSRVSKEKNALAQ